MKRTLRLAPRPFIAFALVLSPLFAILLWIWVTNGFRAQDLFLVIPFLLIYAGFSAVIASTRVSVNQDGLTVSSMMVFKNTVRFAEIDHCDLQILAERDHPIAAFVYRTGEDTPVLTVRLKPYRKEDVQWLISLPELKATQGASGYAPAGASLEH